MKYIFEDLIETKEIYAIIDASEPSSEDREYLVTIVKDTIHHKIVDLVLDELDNTKKDEFLAKVDIETEHPYLIQNLTVWIDNFETKAIKRIRDAENEITALLKSAI